MDERKPSDLAERVVVRTPNGMRERLNDLARQNGRSANAEAVKALEAWLFPQNQAAPARFALPDRLLDLVSRAAKRNHRSVFDEIVDRLTSTFTDAPTEGGLDLRAEIRDAMQKAVEDLLADPERLKLIGARPTP